MVNGIEVLQMSARDIENYDTANESIMYAILHLQTNDEVSVHNISGSLGVADFVGWMITSV